MSKQDAIDKGYTKAIIAESDEYTLELLVKPETDLDSRFVAYDTAENEWLTVNGYHFSIEEE